MTDGEKAIEGVWVIEGKRMIEREVVVSVVCDAGGKPCRQGLVSGAK